MRKKAFFENLGAILTFALIGTVISTFVIALIVYGFAQFITHTVAFKFIDMVYFGAIISATDPVTVLSIFSVIINFSFRTLFKDWDHVGLFPFRRNISAVKCSIEQNWQRICQTRWTVLKDFRM